MAQSLKIQGLHTYQDKYGQKLQIFAEKENLKKRFAIGKAMSKDEALHTIVTQEILCSADCNLTKFIESKIYGEEDCSEPLSKTLYNYKKENCESEDYKCSTQIEW